MNGALSGIITQAVKLRHFSNTHHLCQNFPFHICTREWSYTLITSVWGQQRAHGVLLVMSKHKETPTPPTPPFLVCADSQRSGISQLWKLVSMETRVGREWWWCCWQNTAVPNQPCVSVCAYVGIQETSTTEESDDIFPYKRWVILLSCTLYWVSFILLLVKNVACQIGGEKPTACIDNIRLNTDGRYWLWQAESATNSMWHSCVVYSNTENQSNTSQQALGMKCKY